MTMSTLPRASAVFSAVSLAGRTVIAAARHWREHPLTARALLSAMTHVPARMRLGDFESSMVLTTAQIDTFLESGWDYAEPRLRLLQQATSFPIGAEGVRRIIRMRARMEDTRDGPFDDIVGAVYRDPDYPIFQHLGQTFRNRITGRQPFVLARLAELPAPPRRTCDAGCGSGILLGDVLQASPGAVGFGIDVSDTMVAHARRVLGAWSLGGRANVLVGDIRRLPLPDRSMDFMVSTEVLEHLDHPLDGLRELARVVSAAGRIVTSIPVRDRAPTHLHYFESPEDVVELHRAAGLVVHGLQVADVAPGVPNVLIASSILS